MSSCTPHAAVGLLGSVLSSVFGLHRSRLVVPGPSAPTVGPLAQAPKKWPNCHELSPQGESKQNTSQSGSFMESLPSAGGLPAKGRGRWTPPPHPSFEQGTHCGPLPTRLLLSHPTRPTDTWACILLSQPGSLCRKFLQVSVPHGLC